MLSIIVIFHYEGISSLQYQNPTSMFRQSKAQNRLIAISIPLQLQITPCSCIVNAA